jgi:hypothetical protein
MPRANEQVLETLSSATQSATYKYRKRKGHDILTYSACEVGGGAFTSTIALECATPGTTDWVTVTDGTLTNTEGSGTFVPGGDLDIRWNCTAYTDPVRVRIG